MCRARASALFHFDQLVLAVVVVAGLQCATCATAFFDQVAARIIGEVSVAVEGQAVASCFCLLSALATVGAQDVARRIKVELFLGVAFHGFKPVQRVVVVADLAFAQVVNLA